MTRVTASVDVSSFTSDAKFRALGSAMNTLLSGSGLVQTADTGQINWATVLKPTVSATIAGYEVWKFNDSLQSTTPIFLKISYGSGAVTSGNSFQFTFQIGTSTDGAGTIKGMQTGTVTMGGSNASCILSNTTMALIATHTSGYFGFYCDPTVSGTVQNNGYNENGFFVIDRSRSQTDGTPVAGGWTGAITGFFLASNYMYTKSWTVNTFTGYTDGLWQVEGPVFPAGGTRVAPWYHSDPGPTQGLGLVGIGNNVQAQKATFTCKPIGTANTHTYICVGNLTSTANRYCNMPEAGQSSIAMLWED